MSSQASSENPVANAMHKIEDAAGAMVGMASAAGPMAKDDGMFTANAGASTLYEIQAGEIALNRTASLAVEQFAELIVRDHQRMARTLAKAAAAAPELDARREGMLDHLRKASDDEFDSMFLKQQMAAHREAVALHETFLKGDDAAGRLRGVASSALPVLRQHLAMVAALQSGADFPAAARAWAAAPAQEAASAGH